MNGLLTVKYKSIHRNEFKKKEMMNSVLKRYRELLRISLRESCIFSGVLLKKTV